MQLFKHLSSLFVSELGRLSDGEACASLLMGEGNAVLQCERNSSSESEAQWPTWPIWPTWQTWVVQATGV